MRLFQKSILFILLGLCSDLFSAHLTDCPFTLKLLVPTTALVEGASITVTVVVKNKFDRPVYCIAPRTDAAAQKLFPINFYHRDSVLNLLRITDAPLAHFDAEDTSVYSLEIIGAQKEIAVTFTYPYSAAPTTTGAFKRKAEIPLFAGEYGVRVQYNPYAISKSKDYYDNHSTKFDNHIYFPTEGIASNFEVLRIARTRDSVIQIYDKKYFIQLDKDRQYYWYYEDSLGKGSSMNLVHLSSLPPDSVCMLNEYYYTHFTGVYAEYIKHYPNHKLMEYRRWVDVCPSEITTLEYYPNGTINKQAERKKDNSIAITVFDERGKTLRVERYTADHQFMEVDEYIYKADGTLKKIRKQRYKACLELEL